MMISFHSLLFSLKLVLIVYVLVGWSEMASDSINIKPTVTRGMMIDAGSGGSRLHVYQWSPRIFDIIPPPLSFPSSNEKWTGRMAPGVATFSTDLAGIRGHLYPLIDFAKSVLSEYEEIYSSFPIFFKATGGMRELSYFDRERVLKQVRLLLSDKTFNPFYFRDDFARVISGEEEAIYSWCASNFLFGNLLTSSSGTGAVVSPINNTYGTLDLGGSSTQIAFFAPDQDIMEGLFKLQIGAQKHWNVYAKSFLQFGINSARRRFFDNIIDEYYREHKKKDPAVAPKALSYCFHSGYSERVISSLDKVSTIEIEGPAVPAGDQFDRCYSEVLPLLFKSNPSHSPFAISSSYCDLVYHGQCSVGGAYQPALPSGKFGNFIGTSSYTYPWKFLILPSTASMNDLKAKASVICSMSFEQIQRYYEQHNLNLNKDKLSDYMPYYCFLSAYTYALLVDGYGFRHNSTLTVVDEINGNKVGWAFGAMLYEINALPWEMKADISRPTWEMVGLAVVVGAIIGALIGFCAIKDVMSHKRKIFSVSMHDTTTSTPEKHIHLTPLKMPVSTTMSLEEAVATSQSRSPRSKLEDDPVFASHAAALLHDHEHVDIHGIRGDRDHIEVGKSISVPHSHNNSNNMHSHTSFSSHGQPKKWVNSIVQKSVSFSDSTFNNNNNNNNNKKTLKSEDQRGDYGSIIDHDMEKV